MTTFPVLPYEYEDPWWEKQHNFDSAVKTALETYLSPETLDFSFSQLIPKSLLSEQGDLPVGAGGSGGVQRLPRGLSGQVLTTDPLEPLGLKWSNGLTVAQEFAQQAINAATQALMEGIVSVITEYAVNSSETEAPTSGWSITQPARTPGTFIWVRTITTRGDESSTTSAPALLTGNTGATGSTGSQGIPGEPGEDGQSLYTWIKYADTPTTGMSDLPTGKAYIGIAYNKTSATESSTYSDYQWSLILGPQGIQGPAGADGTPRYTWIKYADTPTTGMSDSPTGKTYMGIAYNKTTSTESSTYADYEWSLIRGPQGDQGIQGPPGEDGQPTYTWIKYGSSATGAGLSDDPTGKTHIGIAYNKTTPTESTTPGDYTWSLIQGPEGPAGDQGIQGPPGEDGTERYTWIKYADSPTTGMSDSPVGKTYMGIAYNKLTATESSTYADYAWSLIQGPQGPAGTAGKGISSTAVTYQVHSNGTTAPTGTWQSTPQATSVGQFLWTRTITTYTDATTSTAYSVAAHGSTGPTGNTGAAGKGISGTEVRYQVHSNGTTAPTGTWQSTPQATSPGQFLWVRTVTTYTDATTTTAYAVSAHGQTGAQGIQGPAGADGSPTYTWIKYATSATGTGISDDPTGKTYIGIAYNKTTPTESTTPGDYEWSLIQGPQGNQGIQGPAGADGTERYTWIKYADTPTTGMSDNPSGKIYMGIAYNKTTATESTNYADYNWSLIQGPQGNTGATGKGISSTTVTYQVGSSGTTAPTGTWQSTPQATSAGQFLWTRTITTYTDSTTSTAYSVAAHGAQGPTGSTGATGAVGRGISSTEVRYQVHSNGTTAPTGTWQTTPQTTSPGQFLWVRTVTTYTDSTTTTAYAVSAHGQTGAQGIQGPPGNDGSPTYTWIKYGTSAAGAGISDDPTGKTYIGIAYNKSTPTESTTPGDYEWSLFQGPQGNQGIQGPAGADGVQRYTWIKYADSPTTGMSDSPSGKTYMGIAYNKTTATESTNYADYAWSLIQGPQGPQGNTGATGSTGAAGKGLSSAVTTYQIHTNGTTAPTGTWVSSPPATSAGQFLWTRTILTWTDATTSTAYSVAAHGATGATGSTGSPGSDGTSATNVVVGNDAVAIPVNVSGATLAASSIVIPFSGWIGDARAAATVAVSGLPSGITAGTNTAATVSADGSLTLNVANASTLGGTNGGDITLTFTCNGKTFVRRFSWAKALTGATGSTGSTGSAGTSATSVDVGNEASVIPCTAAGATTASMTITIPFTAFIGSTRAAATVAVSGLPSGITVTTNTAGTTGAAGSLVLTVASGSTLGGTNTGNITLTITANGLTFVRLFTWTKGITGATGSTGSTGVSVSSVTPYYLLVGTGSPAPAKPTTNPPGGSWSLTEPAYTASTQLYRTELVVYSNASFAYTNVSLVSSYVAAVGAYSAANLAKEAAEGLIKFSQTEPSHAVGRIWFVLDGIGQTIGIKISNGSAWASYALMADSIMVPSSYGAVFLANGSVIATSLSGELITGATIQTVATANRGIKMDSAGFYVYNNSGVKTVDIVGSTGAITITGTINATGGTISGVLAATGNSSSDIGFDAYDTTRSVGTKLRPRGLQFRNSDASQTTLIESRVVTGGDLAASNSLVLGLVGQNGLSGVELANYSHGGETYKIVMRQVTAFDAAVIFKAGVIAGGGHFRQRIATAGYAWTRALYTATSPSSFPAASSVNIVSGDFAVSSYDSSSGRGAGHGLYGYEASAWKLVDLHIKPSFVTNGYEGSSTQAITLNTWTLVGASVLGTPVMNRAFTNWSSGVLTVKEPGIYLVSISSFLLSNTGAHNIRVTRNSTSPGNDADSVVSSNGTGTLNSAMRIAVLNAGDSLRFYVYSGTTTVIRNLPQTNFCVTWMAPL